MLKVMRTKPGNGQKVDLERIVEDLKVVVRDGEELLKIGLGDVKQRAISGIKTTDRALRTHPYQTIGIVFGIGIIVGLLCSGLFSIEENTIEE